MDTTTYSLSTGPVCLSFSLPLSHIGFILHFFLVCVFQSLPMLLSTLSSNMSKPSYYPLVHCFLVRPWNPLAFRPPFSQISNSQAPGQACCIAVTEGEVWGFVFWSSPSPRKNYFAQKFENCCCSCYKNLSTTGKLKLLFFIYLWPHSLYVIFHFTFHLRMCCVYLLCCIFF